MKLFKKVKINTFDKSRVRQIWILNSPFLQYEKSVRGSLKISIPGLRKPKNKEKVFYLKVNSTNSMYVYSCIQGWLNLVKESKADFYIICDNVNLQLNILKHNIFPDGNIKFIKSNRKIPKKWVEIATTPFWRKAAYAHLTTFDHASKNGIKTFWNIDADDTMFMENPTTVSKALAVVEKYAKDNDIYCFSLDMHSSRYYGKHWTFGVTYTQLNTNCFKLLESTKDISWRDYYRKFLPSGEFNIDSYFTYLRDCNAAKINSFNIDNLYFIHWGTVGIGNGYRFIQVEKDGKLHFPLATDMFKNDEFGIIKTADDCINISANIDLNRSYKYLDNLFFKFIRQNSKDCMEA